MLSHLRHLLIDSWFGRILVGLIFLVFISWGAETIIDTWSHQDNNVVAWVGSKRVTMQQLESATNMQFQQYAAQQGLTDKSQIPNEIKASLINQTLQQLITESNLLEAADKAGLTVSDDALRNLVFSFPAFQQNGKFSRELFNLYISQQNTTEANFLIGLRNQLTLSGLKEPLISGISASDIMVKNIFSFSNETRQVSYIQLPFSNFKPNVAPSDAMLKRYYDNHLGEFTLPEFRKVKLIFISPDTVAKSIEVPDQELLQYYNSRKNEFQKPESRNLQIVTVKDQKAAESLATSWKSATWEAVQKQAQQENGFATTLSEFTAQASPSAELTNAVQKTALNTISAPIKTPMGWSVFKVTAIVPAHEITFASVKDQLKTELVQTRAKQVFYKNVREIQDILASGADENGKSGIDKRIGGTGAVPLLGTINQQGKGSEGMDFPIPFEGKAREEVLSNIFSKAKNAPASLIQGDNNTYYAFEIEDIMPAHQETFEEAKDLVLNAWQQENIRKQANIAATSIFKQAQDSHKPIQNQGNQQFTVKESDAFSRITPSKTLPQKLQEEAFAMQMGQSTMFEAPDGFYVATLNNIKTPTPQDNQAGYDILKDNLARAEANDIFASYIIFTNAHSKVQVNQQAVDAIIKQVSY